jgi:methionine sulfoxide reductase heme-binding subunit
VVPGNQWEIRILKPLIFLLALLPMGLLVLRGVAGDLSANPIKDITEETGIWTLRFIVLTLTITPLRKISGWAPLVRFRRMIGLYSFFYGSLHFVTYIYLDQFFAFDEILRDVVKRPFITVGFAAFLMMIPLALTSPNIIAKWMGGKKWRLLHRLVYFTALGGVIHYLWLVKADKQRPLMYGGILVVLLGYRLWDYFRLRRVTGKPIPQTKTNPA